MRAPLLALLLLLAVPAAQAQGHEHGAAAGPILLAHDGPPDGRQFAGNLAHFAAIARGDDAVPDFHQDVPLRVTLDGRVLFEHTPDSGHDYDGVNVLDVVFPRAGRYLVEALGPDGTAVAAFGGEVLAAPGPEAAAGIALAFPGQVVAGTPASISFNVGRGVGSPSRIPHSDCWFEVVRNGATEFRTKLHTHEEDQALEYTFVDPGGATLRVTCFQAYPSPRADVFPPVTVEQTVQVLPGLPAPGAAVDAGQRPLPPAALNAVVLGASGGELLLVGTYDPYTVVGTGTLQHLNVLAVDPATGQPRQHVDFEATLTGPAGGVLFRSDTLHEYDGIYELATRQSTPGLYVLDVVAEAGDWSDRVSLPWLVAPPAAPTSAGVVAYALEGQPGQSSVGAELAASYTLQATATSGPFAHSEVELRALAAGSDVPLLVAKLHTHDDGRFPFAAAFTDGRVSLQVDGFPLMPEAVLVPAGVAFDLDVPPAPAAGPLVTGDDAQELPAATAVAPLLLALAAALRRR